MKILSLRFTNLNSLQGSWEIDFTHPSFASEGIFAITGRTGAGKSTILDAICLALFGQTPRLKTISASTNDIMSRHTGECSAEVDFSTHKGSYRATWYQNRARKKIDGALQQPKHTLAELESETFLTEKTTDTVREIEEITGLNFTRFTRSVLLAQGSFAAFLQARDDERSDVLEQLTGTEIYSDISMAVYNQTKEERLKLERLQESVQALRLLSPEELHALELQLGDEEEKRSRLQGELEHLQGVLSWFKTVSQLQEELARIGLSKVTLAQDKEAFLPLQESLALAQKALELDAPYVALASQRSHVGELEKEFAVTQTSLAADEKTLALLVEERRQAEIALTVLRKKHQEEKLVHSKVRELDTLLRQRLKNEESARTSLERAQQEVKESKGKALGRRGEVLQAYEAGVELYCRKFVRSPHQILEEGFWPMERLGQKIIELLQERNTVQQELAGVSSHAQKAERTFADIQERMVSSQKELAAEEQKLLTLHGQRETLLAGKSMGLVRAQYDEVQEQMGAVQEALALASQLMEVVGEYSQGQRSLVASEQAMETVSQEISHSQQQVAGHREELAALEKTSLFVALQGHRDHLTKGEPCPLCGALEHPYIDECLLVDSRFGSESDETFEKALADLEGTIRQGDERIAQLQAKQAEARGRGKVLLEQQALYEKRLMEQSIIFHKALATLGVSGLELCSSEAFPMENFSVEEFDSHAIEAFRGNSEALLVRLRELNDTCKEKRQELRKVLDGGESLQAAMEKLNGSIASMRLACDSHAQGVQEATIAVEGVRGKLIELRQKQGNLNTLLAQKLVEWRELVHPLSHTPNLPQDIRAACLQSLPPVPSFLVEEADARMKAWLQKYQGRMLEALGGVTPALDYKGEGPGREEEGSLDNLGVEEVETWLTQLSSLRERWLELEGKARENKQRLEMTLPLLALAEEAVFKAEKMVTEQRGLYEGAVAESKKTLHERQVLFGEQSLEEAEKVMHRMESEAEERLKHTASQENAVEGKMGATRRQYEELTIKIQASRENLSQAEQNFRELLAGQNFVDEVAFRTACLPAVRRKELEAQAQELANRHIELEAQEREKTLLLKEKHQQAPLGENESLTAEKISLIQTAMRQCGESIGSLRQKIEHNTLQEKHREGQLAEIAAQQVEFGRWETLNVLIGHSEGKKFRRFAQGLTFEAVVSEANKVLARLSERYTLLRDKENPLELNVCDSDQAGEIRSTRNLSGGESFIVSLALALGLSSMASRTVRLDSLFLDEGFGALDEDSLDVALDVLSSLPDDGKVIGIISHVSSLKERIRKSIQVIPMAGGRSRLEEGEGVRRL